MMVLDSIYADAHAFADNCVRAPSRPAGSNDLASVIAGDGAMGGQRVSLSQAAEQYKHNTGWVYTAVAIRSNRIAGQAVRMARLGKSSAKNERFAKNRLPEHLKELRNNLVPIEDHPVLQAIRDPNELMVEHTLKFASNASIDLTGRSHWLLGKSQKKNSILPLPSNWIRPAEGSRLHSAWEILPNGRATGNEKTVSGDDVAYFFQPDPSDPMNAISTLAQIAKAVLADESIQEAQKRVFQNGPLPDLLISLAKIPGREGTGGTRPRLTDAQYKEVVTTIRQRYQGVVRASEPFFLDGLIDNVQKLTHMPREMDFLDSGKWTKERIFQAFGLNAIIAGEIQNANRAAAYAADEHFCNSLNPRIVLLSQCMTAWLLPRFGVTDPNLIIFLEPCVPTDTELDLKRAEIGGKFGVFTVDEMRGFLGLAPLGGEEGSALVKPPAPGSQNQEGKDLITFDELYGAA